ncbi:MAG: Gldg family protein [Gammaproteobacteria bacterium]|nr:Gldg family protein [Gammaproteobacteria bacterium]
MSSATRSAFGRLGLVALAVMFVVAVSLANVILRGARLDLTENRLYTLAPGTGKVLGNIAEPINLYFFFSDKATADIPYLRAYADRVRDMLREFAQASGGRLRVTEIDPVPFSDEEDRATQFGLQGIRLENSPDPIFMGVAGANSVGDDEVIAFLDPTKEAFLEYDLAKLVYSLANPKRPVVGLLSSLPISAGFDPMTQQVRQPWAIVAQLRQLFDVRQLDQGAASIADDVQVLMIVHPKGLSEQTLYAVDQFILRGGRAMIFVDPWAEADPGAPDPGDPTGGMGGGRSSELPRLLGAWGVSVTADQFVGDDRYALQVVGPDQRPVRDIGLIGVPAEGLDQEDVVTAGLGLLNFGYAGAITRGEKAAATLVPLVRSSDLAAPVGTAALGFLRDPQMLREGFEPDGTRYTLAARITGKLPSAFPQGAPAGAASGGKPHLAEAAGPVNVVLVADADFLSDRLWVQTQNFFGQRLSNAFANNGDFVVNALDNLLGSSDLIGIRGRAAFTRPFTRVQELRRVAEDRFRVTEDRLKQELSDTEEKLTQLQARREDRDTMILTPEQEQELERFRDRRVEIRRELRQVQRNLDQEIETLGNWLKAINIGLVPLLISVAGIVLVLMRRPGRRGS